MAGHRYFTPAGFTRQALELNRPFPEDWPVAFHGTRPARIASILQTGLGVRPPLAGHVEPNVELFGIADWANAVFVTPSYKYATFYGTVFVRDPRVDRIVPSLRNGKVVVTLLQCRINPAAFGVFPETIGAGSAGVTIDANLDNGALEWRIPAASVPNNIVVYGVLFAHVEPHRFSRVHTLDAAPPPSTGGCAAM